MIEVLTRSAKAATIEALLDDDVFAPDLLVAEVLHYFRYELNSGRLDEASAQAAVSIFEQADIEIMPTWPLTSRIWELRHNITSYDACYVALAESLNAPLITTDYRLSRAPGLPVQTIVL